MPVYLKIVLGDWRNASRDKRELRVAIELGYETVVIATTKESKKVFIDQIEEFKVIRVPTRKYGNGKMQSLCGKVAAIRTFIKEAKNAEASVISGHNYSGWLVGFWAYKGKNNVKYIYDCHEYELYRNQKSRGVIAFHIVKAIEKFVVKHSDINIMVSDSISNAVKDIYKISERPLVIRNMPERSDYEALKIRKRRQEFLSNLAINEMGIVLMYHGGLAPGRGIEQAIQAISKLTNTGLVLMGYALEKSYEKKIINQIKEFGCEDKVYMKPAVPFSELYENVAAADIGIILIQNICTSFLYSLPNKLFENIQAMIPVIGSDFPEIGHIIDCYGIGIKIRPDDVAALVEAIETMRNDKELYDGFKENLVSAREELCWEKEKIKLRKAIESLSNG